MLPVRLDHFFDAIRPMFSGGRLNTDQVGCLNALLGKGLATLPNLESMAYVLATAFHETAHTMQPVAEYGKGKNYDYGKMLDMGGGPGRRLAYTAPPVLYYGRGFVQLTWRSNYAALGKIIGVDLLNHPDLALDREVAAQIAIQGMLRGYFTGRKLADYFPTAAGIMAPIAARRIINGMDCADMIAGYYQKFLTALRA